MRSVKEWAPRSDDTPIPNRVRLRVYLSYDGKCCDCGRDIGPRNPWAIDHKIALINGGLHAESNLQPICRACHMLKTAGDVEKKSLVNRILAKHIGLKKRKRIMPGSRASKWKHKANGDWVLR